MIFPVIKTCRLKPQLAKNGVTRYQAAVHAIPGRRLLQTAAVSTDHNVIEPVKSFKDMPGPRGFYNIPYIGFLFHLKPFSDFTIQQYPDLLNALADRYGPIYRLQTSCPSVVVTDSSDFATVLRNEGKYPKRPSVPIFETFYQRTGINRNVSAMQGEDWYVQRAPIQRTMMKPSLMHHHVPLMNGVAGDLVQMLSKGYLDNHSATETFMSYALENIGAVCFGRRFGFLGLERSHDVRAVQEGLSFIFDMISKSFTGAKYAFRFYRNKDYRDFESAIDAKRKFILARIAESKNDIVDDENNSAFRSLLSETTEEEALTIIEAMFLGGVDSSASAFQVMLHALAKHPEIQDKLRKEVRSVIGDDPNVQVCLKDIENMPYLKACVKEMYRRYPLPSTGVIRYLPVDVVLSGYNVPAGVQILVHNYKSCGDANLFENPETYKPERWLRQGIQVEGNDANRHWAILPFGTGIRGCPGRRIFEMELYITMSKIIQTLEVGLRPESQSTEFEYHLFRKSIEPLEFTFTHV